MVSASHRVDVLQNTKRGVRAFTISGLYSQLKNKQTNEPIHTQSHEWLKVDMNISESRLVLFVHHPLHPLRRSPKMISVLLRWSSKKLSNILQTSPLKLIWQACTSQHKLSHRREMSALKLLFMQDYREDQQRDSQKYSLIIYIETSPEYFGLHEAYLLKQHFFSESAIQRPEKTEK